MLFSKRISHGLPFYLSSSVSSLLRVEVCRLGAEKDPWHTSYWSFLRRSHSLHLSQHLAGAGSCPQCSCRSPSCVPPVPFETRIRAKKLTRKWTSGSKLTPSHEKFQLNPAANRTMILPREHRVHGRDVTSVSPPSSEGHHPHDARS